MVDVDSAENKLYSDDDVKIKSFKDLKDDSLTRSTGVKNTRTVQLLYEDNSVYKGEIKAGTTVAVKHGYGVFTFADGKSTYEGEFRNGKANGKGTFRDDVIEYVGDWKDDLKNGKASEKYFLDKSLYTGPFKEGLKQGQGKYAWQNGSSYEGAFNADNIEGEGKYISADGSVYQGQFKNNLKHGKGRFEWAGDKKCVYEGEYVEDARHGEGTLTTEMYTYTGQWAEGRQHGKGVLKFPGHPDEPCEFNNGMKVEDDEDAAA
jgi:hypothetical protein